MGCILSQVADSANHDLLVLVKKTSQPVDYAPLLRALTSELQSHHVRAPAAGDDMAREQRILMMMKCALNQTKQVPTRVACLHWLAMLVEKAPKEVSPLIEPVLLPALLRALADASDEVVLLDLQVRTS